MAKRTLAIDTATAACSVALFESRTLLASEYHEIGRGHAEKLVPLVASFPDKGFAHNIIVNCGPGSFTGVRIGISVAKALGLAWNATVSGYQCLHLVAAQALREMDVACSVCVVMQAGHGQFFIQNFSENCIAQDELESLEPDKATQKVQSSYIAGSGVKDLFNMTGINNRQIQSFPNAAEVMLLNEAARSLNVVPIYGRDPDAVAIV